jgi:hypothetical protein
MSMLKQQSKVNNKNTEDDLKMLLRILSTVKKVLLNYPYMTGLHIPGHQLNQSEYALQRVVKSFSNLLFQFAECHLTHTYRVVYHFCELQNINYLVQK